MRLSKRTHGNKLDVNMTPMIDVTFLLLIFFMTVNQVSRANKEQLELAQLKGSQDQSEAALTINIDAAGQVIVSANPVSLPELATILGQEVQKTGGNTNQLKVTLRADRRGTCHTLNRVVAMLVEFDIGNVRMAVESSP
jgi:biopolymer transport protein ExbD